MKKFSELSLTNDINVGTQDSIYNTYLTFKFRIVQITWNMVHY